LQQKGQQKSCRNSLREIKAKASKDSEPVGHYGKQEDAWDIAASIT